MAANIDDEIKRKFEKVATDIAGYFKLPLTVSQQLVSVMSEKLEELAGELDETADITETLRKVIKRAAEDIEKNAPNKSLKSLVKSIDKIDLNFKEFEKKLSREERMMLSNMQSVSRYFIESLRGRAIGDVRKNIVEVLRKMDSMGIIGKAMGFAARAIFGAQASAKRGRVEQGVAALAHPSLFPGQAGTMLSGLSKFAPILLKLAPIISSLGLILVQFLAHLKQVQAIGADLVKSTGASAINLQSLKNSTFEAAKFLTFFDIQLSDIIKSTGALVKDFKNVDLATQDASNTISILAKRTGISEDNLARLYKTLNLNWKKTDKDIRNFTYELKNRAIVYGLSFNDVMDDIVSNSENLTLYFSGSVEKLRDAVLYSHKMGSNLSVLTQTTRKFSRWADAIQSSFMLSVIFQKNFNAASLYTKGVFGDVKGLTEEILSNANASYYSFQRMAIPLKEEVAQALGMSVEQFTTLLENKALRNILEGKGITGEKLEMSVRAARKIAKEQKIGTIQAAEKVTINELDRVAKSISMTEQHYKLGNKLISDSAMDFAEAVGVLETMDPYTKLSASLGGILFNIFSVLSGPIASAVETIADVVTLGLRNVGKDNVGSLFAPAGAMGLAAKFIGYNIEPETSPMKPMSVFKSSNIPKMISPRNEITNSIGELKTFLENENKKPLNVRVYLDGETLAEKLEKYQVRVATG